VRFARPLLLAAARIRSRCSVRAVTDVPSNRLRKSLTATILVPSILVGTATVALLLEFHSQMSETGWVEHTDRVELLAESAKTEFLSAQSALRGFVISSNPADRSSQQEHWNTSRQIIKQLVALVADNPGEEERLTSLNDLENQWLDAASAADSASADTDKRELAQRAGAIGSNVLAQFDTVSRTEEELRIARDSRRDLQYRVALWGIPIAALILIIGLTSTAWREIRRASHIFATALNDAEQANQTKTNFLAVISHELRNPLNSILLWCNALLSSGTLEGRIEQGMSAIFRAAKAQAQLIEDLLDISRIESGQMRFDVQPISPAEVVRAAVDSMIPAAEAKSIAVQTVIDPRASMIVGDSHRLQQAVWNLLSNAIKFTPRDGKVQVRLERINSHLEIVVADNGQGIDQRALENVFDRFWQASRESGDRGLGLGLSIVKHIVNLHGGTVIAHSDGPGKGSIFVIRLPVPVTTAGLESTPRRHPTVSPVAQGARLQRLDGISVLAVDDDAATLQGLRSLLTSLGASCKESCTVEDAIATLAEKHPDVLISDLGMPGRDGYSLIREIREKEKASAASAHLAAIALTAYGRVEDKVEILAAGFDGHVVKPVDPAELAAVIKRLVEAGRSGNYKPTPS
jgi:signal transduction histidine kinase/CheY-like chemotaxis protein